MEYTARHPTLQDADRLIRRLSTFWSMIFDNRKQLLDLFFGRSQAAAQEYLDFIEAYTCAVFKDIPVFHKEMWMALSLTERELNASLLRYGEGETYREGGATYGGFRSNVLYWKLPERIKDIEFIHNSVVNPTVTYVKGTDFYITDGVLYFIKNPFEDERHKFTDLYEGENPVDRGLVLWAQCVDVDMDYLIAHIGAALKLYMPVSESAKAAMVALAKLYAGFPNVSTLNAFMAAIVDVPVAVEDEVVEKILLAPNKSVVTDRHVYNIPGGANIIVKEGDALRPGDMLTDAVKLIELAYTLPNSADFPIVAAGKSLLVGDYAQDLLFPNIMTDSWYDNGKYRFEINGLKSDVDKFWAAVDAKGGLQDLGSRINPAEVLFDCLRGNGIAIKLVSSSFGPYASPRLLMDFLRRIVSPALVILSFIDVISSEGEEDQIASEDELSIIYLQNMPDDAGVAAANALTLTYVSYC